VHPSLPFIVIGDGLITQGEDRIHINKKLGTLQHVFRKSSFLPTSETMYKCLGMANDEKEFLGGRDALFVNWKICSRMKNALGRLPLFTAAEQSIKWSDGLFNILEGYGAAIEESDTPTGLEAFMLAGIGENSDMETVYKLLENHPAAINPYIAVTQQPVSNDKKRKCEAG